MNFFKLIRRLLSGQTRVYVDRNTYEEWPTVDVDIDLRIEEVEDSLRSLASTSLRSTTAQQLYERDNAINR